MDVKVKMICKRMSFGLILLILGFELLNGQPSECIQSEPNINELIIETREAYNDYTLVDEMVNLCSNDSINLDAIGFAKMYNYYVSCKNEDACEGIYYNIYQNVLGNNAFLLNFQEYLDLTTLESKEHFLKNFSESLILSFLIADAEKGDFSKEDVMKFSNQYISMLSKLAMKIIYENDTNRIVEFIASQAMDK